MCGTCVILVEIVFSVWRPALFAVKSRRCDKGPQFIWNFNVADI